MRNRQIHLTNYSIQKKYDAYQKNDDQYETIENQSNTNIKQNKKKSSKSKSKHSHPFFNESKWSIQQLWQYLSEEKNIDTAKVI